MKPLTTIPQTLGAWTMQQEGVVEPEVQEVLKADDLVTRWYVSPSTGSGLNLFIASFRSQRNGKAPHSPKNCLPGNGWLPLMQGEIPVDVGLAEPIPVNRYIVAHGESRSVVMYWYQSRDRAVASEYRAKFWVIADAIRYNRTDTALVKVTVPVMDRDSDKAERVGIEFIKTFYATIREHLPS
jgi:EpsI family protein